MAKQLFPTDTDFSAIFSNSKAGSDIEDGEKPEDAPVRVIPAWRSQTLMECVQLLDKAICQAATTSHGKKAALRSTERSSEITASTWDLANVPQGLGTDCYSDTFKRSCSEIELLQIKVGNKVKLENIKSILVQKTRKVDMPATTQPPAGPSRPPRSPLRDNFGVGQGSSRDVTQIKR